MAEHQLRMPKDCGCGTCGVCRGVVASCKVCEGAREDDLHGSLPTECPGARMTHGQQVQVARGDLDFRNGEWFRPRDLSATRAHVYLSTEEPMLTNTDAINRLNGELETMTRSHEILAKKLQRCERALDVLVASGLVTSEAVVLAKELAP